MSSDTYSSAQIRRREWLIGGVSLLAAGCGRTKGTGYPGYALIATAGQKSVAAVDLTAFRLAKTIPVSGEPAAVVSSGKGGAFVLMPDAGSVALIGPELSVVRSRRLADHLSHIRTMPDDRYLVAVNSSGREVLLINGETLNVEHRRKIHDAPTSFDVSADGQIILSSKATGAIDLLNFRTGDWRHTHLQGQCGSVLFRRPDGQLAIVASIKERVLTALRIPDLLVLAELPLAMEPRNLCLKPDGGQLFVSGPGMDAVAIVFPYNTLEVEQTVLVGRDPGAMACSDDPAYLFVGSASGSDLSIMQVDTRKPVGVVEVGERPTFLTLTPDGQYALVLSEASGDLAVIRVGAIRANRSKTGVALFTMLPVGERPVHCGFVPKQLV